MCGALLEASEIGTRKTFAAILPGDTYDPTEDCHSPQWYGWKYYGRSGRPPQSIAERMGLVEAPLPDKPSAAMTEIREAIAANEARLRERHHYDPNTI